MFGMLQMNVCHRWRVLVVVIPLIMSCSPHLAFANAYLFWTDRDTDTIKRSDLDGNGAINIASINNENYTLHVDPLAMKLYWAGSVTGSIQRSNFDGSNVETVIASGLSTPRELVADSANNRLYWIEQGTGVVRRSALDGSNATNVITSADEPYGLAVDVGGGKLYWTVGTTLGGSADGVWRADLDGQNSAAFQLSGSDGIHGVELDEATGELYWGVVYPGPVGEIQHKNVDGTGFAPLLTGPNQSDFRHLALDSLNQRIYFDDLASGTISRIDYSGGNLAVIVSSGDPHSLAVYIPEPRGALAIFGLVAAFYRLRKR